eukprot:597685-Pyramimonas_sp.AAC.1
MPSPSVLHRLLSFTCPPRPGVRETVGCVVPCEAASAARRLARGTIRRCGGRRPTGCREIAAAPT